MLIGQDITVDAGDLVFRLPEMPAEWQFLIDVIPAQLAAERLAGLSGVDCDSFRLCSYIVEDEWGLLHEKVGSPERQRHRVFQRSCDQETREVTGKKTEARNHQHEQILAP